MTIITISRGSYSMGRAVAEKLAERLGFQCLSREVLLEASEQFNTPELKLEHAIRDAPSLLDRLTGGRQAYIAYIQSALARHLCRDDVVYHGLAGPVLLKNVSHVLKVRVIADLPERVAVVKRRDGLDDRRATAVINRLDGERRKWMRSLYGVDPWDPEIYDLVLNVSRFGVKGAVDLVARAAKAKSVASSPESQRQMEDLALASQVKAALVDTFRDVSIACQYGNVVVYCDPGDRHRQKVKRRATTVCAKIDGVNNLEVHAGVAAPPNAV